MIKKSLIIVLLLNISLTISQSQNPITVTVFAAASLTDAFEAIGNAYEAQNPAVDVLFNFAGSSTLAAQLSQGAPADIFASANPMQMEVVQEAGRIEGESRIFAYNQLVVILPMDNPADINNLADLVHPDISIVIAAPEVPVRVYTDTVLNQLAELDDYPDDFAEQVFANVVSEEANVRRVAAKIALGEADAGIVYTSDVTPDIQDQVMTIAIPDEVNVRATYPIALLNDSAQPQAANDVLDFILSETGQAILEEWGFIPVNTYEEPKSICSTASHTSDNGSFLGFAFAAACHTLDGTGQGMD